MNIIQRQRNSKMQVTKVNRNSSGSQGQQTSSGLAGAPTIGVRPYEFDSCISTEEAFFGLEENKYAGSFKQGKGSNPQEDSTPKATFYNNPKRRTTEEV